MGWPFLVAAPMDYLGEPLLAVLAALAVLLFVLVCLAAPTGLKARRARTGASFNVGRVFTHKWSVNFKWVPCSPIEGVDWNSLVVSLAPRHHTHTPCIAAPPTAAGRPGDGAVRRARRTARGRSPRQSLGSGSSPSWRSPC